MDMRTPHPTMSKEENGNNNDDDVPLLLDEYVLSYDYIADGDPVRCVTSRLRRRATPPPPALLRPRPSSHELLVGSQGGIVSRVALPSDAHDDDEARAVEIRPGGPNAIHPHQISAILSASSSSRPPFVAGDENASSSSLYITGCKDGKIRIFNVVDDDDDNNDAHELVMTLEGHANAVTSLSWIESSRSSNNSNEGAKEAPWLVSGSWDGTARIWCLRANSCLCILDGHENTVSVAGLPPLDDDDDDDDGGAARAVVRRVVTTSAGIASGSSIRGHAVRIWQLKSSSSSSSSTNVVVTSELVAKVVDDHSGPIRDVTYDTFTEYIYTCSNDGTVKVRSSADGKCLYTLVHPASTAGNGDVPMLLSLCIVGGDDSSNKAVVAGAEDGTVIIWDVSSSSSSNRNAQIVAHPGCVWGVSSIVNYDNDSSTTATDFVTACHDGHVRVFTRVPSKMASDTAISTFQSAVSHARASRSTGPSADEIANLPRWEMNTLTQGRSEGQVQVFQRDGKAIAAQWSAASRTWIVVGEVTGSNANAGSIDGINYDHVFPIEIDMPGGGVRTLQIGYNNGDNPFVIAQTFIDTHTLNQGYLAQIADYIRQRAGETGPTLGMDGGGSSSSSSGSSSSNGGGTATTMMETTPIYNHIPVRGYKVFDAGVDKAGLGKVLSKICEFNNSALLSSKYRLTGSDIDNTLSSFIVTLSTTNRYHVSTISDIELGVVHTMITQWGVKYAFPALDLARVMVLHPDATCTKRRGYWIELLSCTLDMCLGLVDGTGLIVDEVAIPMLTMRLIANCYKGGSGSADAAGSMVDR